MNWKARSAFLAAVLAFAMTAVACGSSPSSGSSGGSTPKGSVTIAGFNFTEGSVLAELYGQALEHDGYSVQYKLRLGNREVVSKAIEAGSIDAYIGYAATDLEFYNKGAGEATGDAAGNVSKLNGHLQSLSLAALNPSAAIDQNAFAMTKANAQKFNATKLSDLASVGNQIVLGGPPECASRPFCEPGLTQTYGIHFKDFKSLDPDGPLTRAALANGSIQLGLVFSSDGDLNSLGLVVLQDDKHLESADNVVPIIRSSVASAEVKKIMNAVSAGLTTNDLIDMNNQAGPQHQDPDAVAAAYLQKHNYFS
ncbi:MAG TPA: ABC transporter substrate-binding protein [Candidatus Dormibacteraeota bacterium]|nr:ABC transporter substrate-binding protein [Candidatus Dormibacteraeota bacterium]